jgi:hypothetical protein
MYDFAPDPSEFHNMYMRKIVFFFYQCTLSSHRKLLMTRTLERGLSSLLFLYSKLPSQ